MNEQAFDIIIIGAGIVGAACAREFAQEGMKVAGVDVNSVGSGATAAGMGHVVVMDDSEAQFALGHLSQQLWTSFAKKLLSASEYHCCGTIWVAADDEEMGEVERKKAFYQARGVASEILSSTTLYQAEPHLRQGLAGGLLIPGDNAVYPPFIAQYFIEEAANKGAMLLIGKKATQLISETVILEDGSELYAPIIVNACGSWSPTLTTQLKIKPRKGHLLITERYPGFVKHQLIELGYIKSAASLETDSVAFNVQPRMTGQILLGSSRQFDEDPQVDSEILAKMVTRAGRIYAEYLRAYCHSGLDGLSRHP